MPKRTDIQSILIIGAGPIVIGQACEFDYSGVQAVKALKEEGYRVILVNSNPATIMTDPEMADATYIEPITAEFVEKIIEIERPDALLPTMGGQTALNCALELANSGVLHKYGVEMIGARADAIDKAEDREKFRAAMAKIGLESPRAVIASSPEIRDTNGRLKGYDKAAGVADAMRAVDEIGLPAIIRPAFTLGGTGGGVAYNRDEYEKIVRSGIDASPTGQVLIDESLLGWKEYEMEVVRDRADNCIIICSIENIDPMGVHTGDSMTVAPALTLTDREYQRMRNASIAVLREIGVETGGSNVQFAVNPENGRLVVIEMNPRVSRSSALASKATGFPIARVAAKLAIGYTLDELGNDITGGAMPASFEPTIDYVVTKIPRFAFEKFPGAQPLLTTAMKSVGEAMAIGRTFQESLQKALRSLETGLCGLDPIKINDLGGDDDINAYRRALAAPTPDRLRVIAEALRAGLPVEQIRTITAFDPWFLEQIRGIIDTEEEIQRNGLPADAPGLFRLKSMGFSDKRLAQLCDGTEDEVRAHRRSLNVRPVYKRIDTCAAEFRAVTPYMYSSYEAGNFDESEPSGRKKVIILGGGPNRIGQGIEFDYCCCHAAFALEKMDIESIMVNCNPETVSTDYDTSDRLYFEPLTAEDVLELVAKEQESGELLGVIVQYGGQTPLNLADTLAREGVPILGTSVDAIALAEDREKFQGVVRKLGLVQPKNATASNRDTVLATAEEVGFPLVTRPSYVLGGRAMEIIRDRPSLVRYLEKYVDADLMKITEREPLLLDQYLQNAVECDVDAICDGDDVYVAAVMEHIEEAGVHSGDSACSLPAYTLDDETIARLKEQTVALAKALGVRGLMNVQYAIKDNVIYLLEVNPRASRTVPFVAKSIGVPVAQIAARVMAGEKLASFDLPTKPPRHVAVKEVVFPFSRFPGVDTVLGPEMRSTGEVMGIDEDFDRARAKSLLAANLILPMEGTVFISVKDSDKQEILAPARRLIELGFKLIATGGTASWLREHGVEVKPVNKVLEGQPHIVDALINGEVQMIFNTTETAQSIEDSRSIRTTALQRRIMCITTLSGAKACVRAIDAMSRGGLEARSLQSYYP
ncbi:carbamoyl-phosphate synthase large subunit [Parvularcula sp. LCG005]|uniref:carbamoyl-phosphate synthase large subunit n=1 Tax=Parvularcula sp. LCG005 TaxID=3078805 RepID=UPI002941FE09|nr:carbamoyl-phosphate synthase large subunit [Parvularcula sp. LCG005]WOI54236.1 carbamoyl-phosphate synthase large subunit [Parvularcula sp. LCG005]